MNKVLVALLSAFTVFAASAATPAATDAPTKVKPAVEMAAPAAKPTAAHKAAHVKKVKHVAQVKAMKHKATEKAAPTPRPPRRFSPSKRTLVRFFCGRFQSRTNSVTNGSSPSWRLRWPCSAGSKVAPSGRVSAE